MNEPRRERFLSLTGALMLAGVVGAAITTVQRQQGVFALSVEEPVADGIRLGFLESVSAHLPFLGAVALASGCCPPWRRWALALGVLTLLECAGLALCLSLIAQWLAATGKTETLSLPLVALSCVAAGVQGGLSGWCVRLPRNGVLRAAACTAGLFLAVWLVRWNTSALWDALKDDTMLVQVRFTAAAFGNLAKIVPFGLLLEWELRNARERQPA